MPPPARPRTATASVRLTLLSVYDVCVSQLYLFGVARGPFREDFYQCVTHGKYTAIWQERLYSTVTVLVTYILPLVVMETRFSSSWLPPIV